MLALEESFFHFVLPFQAWIFYSVSIVLLAAGITLSYWGTRGLSISKRAIIVLLRTAFILLLLFLWAQPGFHHQENFQDKGTVVLLFDSSESMNVKDKLNGFTRHAQMKEHWVEMLPLRKKLSKRFHFEAYSLQDKFKKVKDGIAEPSGNETNYAAAVERILDKHRLGLRAIGILGDGRQTVISSYPRLIQGLERMRIPLYAVGYGSEQELSPDIQLGEIQAPRKVQKLNTAVISMPIVIERAQSKEVSVSLSLDGKIIKTWPPIFPTKVRHVQNLAYPIKFDTKGFHRLEFRATPLKNEVRLNDNVRGISIKVTEAREKILFLDGRLRWEHKYLKKALGSLEQFDLLTITAYMHPLKLRNAIPIVKEEWERYKLIIIGDISKQSFSAAQLKSMRDFVVDGGGILFLGGLTNNAASSFIDSSLEGVVPVTLSKSDTQIDTPFKIVPTQTKHYVTRWVGNDGMPAWKDVPDLEGMLGVGKVKPGAKLLLLGAEKRPLLAVQDFGNGRSAFFAGDTTFKWILQMDKGKKFHEMFWRRLTLWLTRGIAKKKTKDLTGETNKPFYRRLEKIELKVEYKPNKINKKEEQAKLMAYIKNIKTGDALNPIELGIGPGEQIIPLEALEPGEYKIFFKALSGEEVLAEDSTVFTISSITKELENSSADLASLSFAAKSTGGKFYSPNEMKDFYNDLLALPLPEPILKEKEDYLWDDSGILLAFLLLSIFLICLEWFIRKKNSLP